MCLAECCDISLGTRKSAQTGILHSWRLYANDQDPKLCPVRANILLAKLYGKAANFTGLLYRHIDKCGAVLLDQPVVRGLRAALDASP